MEGEGEGGEGGGLTGFILDHRLEEAPGRRRGEEEKEKEREEAGTDPADQEVSQKESWGGAENRVGGAREHTE